MYSEWIEKRVSKRVFFSDENNISAEVFFPGNSRKSFPVTVLNICENGINLFVRKQKSRGIHTGDILILKSILTPEPIGQIDMAEVEVKFVLGDDAIGYYSLGCEFREISENYRRNIRMMANRSTDEQGNIELEF